MVDYLIAYLKYIVFRKLFLTLKTYSQLLFAFWEVLRNDRCRIPDVILVSSLSLFYNCILFLKYVYKYFAAKHIDSNYRL